MLVCIIPFFFSTLLLFCSLLWLPPCQQFFNPTTASNPLTLSPSQCSSSLHVLIFVQTQLPTHRHLLFSVPCQYPHLLWPSFPIISPEKIQPLLNQHLYQLLPCTLKADFVCRQTLNLFTGYLWSEIHSRPSSIWKWHCICLVIHFLTL